MAELPVRVQQALAAQAAVPLSMSPFVSGTAGAASKATAKKPQKTLFEQFLGTDPESAGFMLGGGALVLIGLILLFVQRGETQT